ncbi:MAG TPA: hypothetical protein VIV66_05155 [Pyrinomonadaceae bacterium]
MNCQKFETVIRDLAQERMLETAIRDSALAHSGVCRPCAKKLADQRALTSALRVLAHSMEAIEAPALLQQNIVAAFRERQVIKQSKLTAVPQIYMAGAIAAILLAVIGIVAATQFYYPVEITADSRKSQPPIENSPASLRVVPTKEPLRTESATSGPTRPTTRRRGSKKNAIRNTTTANETTPAATDYATEIATEFLPLGYGNALNLQDGGQIVRVEMPRSTLASFGLPVNTNRVSELVKADLLIGADGSARAIRFVQ